MTQDEQIALVLALTPAAALFAAWRMRSIAPLRWLMLAVVAVSIVWPLINLFTFGYAANEPQLFIVLAVLLAWGGALLAWPTPWLVGALFALATAASLGLAWLLAFFRMTRLF